MPRHQASLRSFRNAPIRPPALMVLAIALTTGATTAVAAGGLDPTFANGPVASSVRWMSLAIAGDGRIALGGTVWGGSFASVRFGTLQVFDADGHSFDAFGNHGAATPQPGAAGNYSLDATIFDPLGRLIVGGANQGARLGLWVNRLRADGQPSPVFAMTATDTGDQNPLRSASALALDAERRILVGGSSAFDGGGVLFTSPVTPIVARLGGDGGFDTTFGVGGVVALPGSGQVRMTATDDRQRIIVAARVATRCELHRLSTDGSIDAAFGVDGLASVESCSTITSDRGGRVLLLTKTLGVQQGNFLLRLVDGRADPSFGNGGAVALPYDVTAIATATDGAVLVAGSSAVSAVTARVYVLRVRSDGAIDSGYGMGGEAGIAIDHVQGGGISSPVIAIDAYDRAVVAVQKYAPSDFGIAQTQVHWYRFTGREVPIGTTGTAVEYYHAEFDHYFTTANTEEIAALDAGKFSGWLRTGLTFPVATRAMNGRFPTCRFFSGDTFAPKSSHFYTHYPAECDLVSANRAWTFEKNAYAMGFPVDAGSGGGTCAEGTVPLYRAYNQGASGAPNHRYTTSSAVLDEMIAKGWVFEGEAGTRVFACVPG